MTTTASPAPQDDDAERLRRAQRRVAQLEATLLDRTRETARVNDRLRQATEFQREVYRALPDALFLLRSDGTVEDANDTMCAMLGYRQEDLIGLPIGDLFIEGDTPDVAAIMRQRPGRAGERVERVCRTRGGEPVAVLFSAAMLPRHTSADRRSPGAVCVVIDIRARKQLEAELRQAQKLESLGRLSAGVAHEINTPVQFVTDSMTFVRDAVQQLQSVIDASRALQQVALASGAPSAVAAVAAAREAEEQADLDYSLTHVPAAIGRALEGLDRIARIVRSMKSLAHPDDDVMRPVDLDHAMSSTLTVAASEYRQVADLEVDLGGLPPVTCYAGEVNQVFLNLIVNAAHAIADRVAEGAPRGRITVRTRRDKDSAVITIADTGGGIPEAIRERVFDPFFTTKKVGRGTGQGLAIARAAICDKHRGALSFESVPGVGTTFTIRLPI